MNKQRKSNKRRVYSFYPEDKIYDWQLLTTKEDPVKTLLKQKKFGYMPNFTLRSEGSTNGGTGNLLVEWFFRQDRYEVQGINVPTDHLTNKKYAPPMCISLKDHYINPHDRLLLLFEVYCDQRGISVRVRHIPTNTELKSWTNTTLPKLKILREGHKEELRSFLGSHFTPDADADHFSFGSDKLLDRIEKPAEAR
jgi:hypothetical protein